jgi:uncharacterized protein (TIGR00369 family)
MLRDLGLRLERGRDVVHRVTIPAPDETRGPHGGVRAGILATGVDVVAAVLALRSLSPDWLATADLAVWTRRTEQHGPLIGEARVLRSGNTTAVIEVDIADRGAGGAVVALAQTTFVRIKRPAAVGDAPSPEEEDPGALVVEFATADSRLSAPFYEMLGYQVLDAATGALELPRSDYTINSFGSLQGGMVAILMEIAAALAATTAAGQPQAVIDLSVRYLSPGPSGPYRTRAEVLRAGQNGNLLRVEVSDAGSDRCMAVGTALAISVG